MQTACRQNTHAVLHVVVMLCLGIWNNWVLRVNSLLYVEDASPPNMLNKRTWFITQANNVLFLWFHSKLVALKTFIFYFCFILLVISWGIKMITRRVLCYKYIILGWNSRMYKRVLPYLSLHFFYTSRTFSCGLSLRTAHSTYVRYMLHGIYNGHFCWFLFALFSQSLTIILENGK